MTKVMPTRDDASQDREEICDLDVIISKRICFRLGGRDRLILPVTTERLFAYISATANYLKLDHETVEESNAAYFAIIKTVCDDITLEEISRLSVVQKGALAEHLARKISGRKSVDEDLKKKVMTS
jgi:hypothetical protein